MISRPYDLVKPFIDIDRPPEHPEDIKQLLIAFEEMIPGTLPLDYVDTLLSLRGRTLLRPNRIVSIEPPRPREFGILESVEENPGMEILHALSSQGRTISGLWKSIAFRMPAYLLPIAESGSPSMICIDLSEGNHGRIYHWFHLGDPGPDDIDGRPGRGNTFLLADSFTDLCRRLRPAPTIERYTGPSRICKHPDDS